MLSLKEQSNHHFKYTIEVKSTKLKAWKVLINVSDWHKWDTELKEAKLFGKFDLGAKGVLFPKNSPKLKFEISEYSEGNFYTFRTKMPVGYLEIKRVLTVENGFTYFTDDIQFTGFLKYIFGAFLGKGFKTVLPEVMQNFKNIVEKNESL